MRTCLLATSKDGTERRGDTYMSNQDLEVSTAGVVVALGRALSLAALFERMQMAECEVC